MEWKQKQKQGSNIFASLFKSVQTFFLLFIFVFFSWKYLLKKTYFKQESHKTMPQNLTHLQYIYAYGIVLLFDTPSEYMEE